MPTTRKVRLKKGRTAEEAGFPPKPERPETIVDLNQLLRTRKGPIRIEIHHLPEPVAGSGGEQGRQQTTPPRTDFAADRVRAILSDGSLMLGREQPHDPKPGEIERLLIELEQRVQGLFDDQRLLVERLEFTLMPSLLSETDGNEPKPAEAGMGNQLPASRFGRRLLELIEEVSKLRMGLNDLTARVAL